MTDPMIEKEEHDARHGRYVARIEGIDAQGELTFTHRSPDIVSADHTGVPEAMRGHGIAKALLDFMLADVNRNDFRIIPVCPFVRKQYARHPEWANLFTAAPDEDPQF